MNTELTQLEKQTVAEITLQGSEKERKWLRIFYSSLLILALGLAIFRIAQEIIFVLLIFAALSLNKLHLSSIIYKLSREPGVSDSIANVDVTRARRNRAIMVGVMMIVGIILTIWKLR